jgi:quinol monooxygenase YgiN
MIAVIATVKVREGREAEFESLFAQLKALVNQHEPGTVAYDLFLPRNDSGDYKIIEHYLSATHWQCHKEASYTREFVPQLHTLFAQGSAEILDSVQHELPAD